MSLITSPIVVYDDLMGTFNAGGMRVFRLGAREILSCRPETLRGTVDILFGLSDRAWRDPLPHCW